MANVENSTTKPDQLFLAVEKNGRLDVWVENICRYLNPILIKESRQSLKSYQFVVTFGLVLFSAIFWSFTGLSTIPIGSAYGSATFLTGFNWILLFPLTVIVPVWTFWSQVTEQEENSLELVTLSTMKPSQIISGKIVSAFLQVMVYMSVLAPCMCFTYLLRGIGIGHVTMSLVVVLMATIALNCIALFLATSANTRAIQIIFLIGLVLLCFFTFFMFGGWMAVLLMDAVIDEIFNEDGGYAGFLGFCFMMATYSYIAFQSAVSNITFPSDNRSTRIRIALLIQQAVFIGWCIQMYRLVGFEFIFVAIIFSSIHWAIVGNLIVGESGRMSQRVRRGLPRTFVGQLFLGWLMPGPQRGFFFVVSNIWATGFIFSAIAIYESQFGTGFSIGAGANDLETAVVYFLLMCSYPTFYVGLTAIIASLLRKVFDFPFPILTLVIGAFNAFALLLFPLILVVSLFNNPMDYAILLCPSWSMICYGVISGEIFLSDPAIWIAVCLLTAPVLAINLFIVFKELGFRREKAPKRVLEEMEAENPKPIQEDIDIFAEDS